MSLIIEFPGGFQLFSDGSYKHLDHEVIAASSSTETSCDGYKFKDVTIDSLKPITARMFLPDVPESVVHQQLPLLVHFHGGAFCFGTTTWPVYHTILGNLSVISKAIIFSVDYRLAPDHKLPVTFDDCYASLEWLITTSKNRGGGDSSDQQWLQRADFSRVFLLGDSAGANIVHQVATRAIQDEAFNVKIKGLLSIHPLFGSENKTESEMANDRPASYSAAIDMLWKLSLPDGVNHDYYGCNFESKQLSANE